MTPYSAVPPPIRCLTFDVEEYFHIEAAYLSVGPTRWHAWPSRVEASIDALLTLCETHGCRATFFVLGDVARRCPALAPRIAAAGHEVACHGYNHDRLHRLSPAALRQDAGDAKRLLEDQAGQPVLGYRAPTFSLTRDTAWAVDTLLDLGFAYDSSLFPVAHPDYGVPDAPLTPHRLRAPTGRHLLEVPPLVWRLRSRHIPVAGGGYFRLLPLAFMERGLRQAAAEERPAVLYFHPWEFDPALPRMPMPLGRRIRTYTGLRSSLDRLDRIVGSYGPWIPLRAALPAFHQSAVRRAAFTLAARRPAAAA